MLILCFPNKYYRNLIENITQKPALVVNTFKDGKRFWGINQSNNMTIDAIIGNPPYQLVNENDNQNRNAPIYQKFVQLSINIAPNYLSMITPARWYFSNILLGDFPQQMVSDTRFSYLHDYTDCSNIFPTVEIKSGVCYFLWDKNHNDKCKIDESMPGMETQSFRFLKSDFDEGFIRYSKALPIIQKVMAFHEPSFSQLVSPQNPFGFNTAVKGSEEKRPNSVAIISKGKSGLQELWIERSKISLHENWVDQIKILTSKAAEDGILPGKVISKLYIVSEGKCCNGTYMVIGPFGNNLKQCENALSYIRTKFFRFFVGIKKPTQDLKDITFSLVPIQDFSRPWTDSDLYAKYNLSKDEISFIESMIKPME